MPPEKAAAKIVGAIKGDKQRLLIAAEAPLIDWIRRLMPEWGNRVLNFVIIRTLNAKEAYDARLVAYRQRRVESGFKGS